MDISRAVDTALSAARAVLEDALCREIEKRIEPIGKAAETLAEDVKLAYSIEETAKMLSLSTSALKPLVYSGRIASVKAEGMKRVLIPREAIIEFLSREMQSRSKKIEEGYAYGNGFIRRPGNEQDE